MSRWVAPVKYFAYFILLLMLVAIVYGATMAVTYWTGINV